MGPFLSVRAINKGLIHHSAIFILFYLFIQILYMLYNGGRDRHSHALTIV